MVKKLLKKNKSIPDGLDGTDWAENVWKVSWTYIKTVVDRVREPFLILDKNLRVIAASKKFYQTFKVLPEDTENNLVYNLGDGQWNIPELKSLLEDVLPRDTFFNNFHVSHKFPNIGQKNMILNGRQVYQDETETKLVYEPIIFLAIEDISELTNIAEKLSRKTHEYETQMVERTKELDRKITELVDTEKITASFNKTILELKKQLKNQEEGGVTRGAR